MSWAYLGLDSLFNTVYNTVVSLYQAFLATVSNIDPRYLLTAGSSTAVSTIVENPASSGGVVSQVLNLGASVINTIASVPMGIINFVSGNASPEATSMLGDGKYPLAIIPKGSSSTAEALVQAVKSGIESHPYLFTGCVLAATGGALLYKYSDANKDIKIKEESSLSTPKAAGRSIRKSEITKLMAEAESFIGTSQKSTTAKF